ncbi:MAG: redox-regulated ATPase YchF [Bacteroidales bacterium]|nr:redox-regulated ATPase YchF [Bacteroidales bacterium]MBR1992643.1 redox-regulated ATPase YchF [Bacteroidales bacterium]MDD6583181.1 redox-regulated ATPase YchF [Bacteroidales bacterium]
MGLKCGIIGLTNTGKTTMFNCISNTKAQITDFAYSTNKSNVGVCNVPDERLAKINTFIQADKLIYATVDVVDVPGLAKGASQGEGIGNAFLADIRQCDALIHVLRCFDNPNLPHVEGSVDPVRDIEIVEFELQVKDLEQINRKLQKVEKAAKIGDKNAKRDYEALIKYKNHLENFQNVRTLNATDEEKAVVADMMLLTDKPVLFVCNVNDDALENNPYVAAVREALKDQDCEILVIAGKLESEIAELEDEADRMAFLEDVGLKEPGVNKVIRAAYKLLNLISFFTVGGKENRAWTIREGMTAPQAAGVIHSDLERGFIRAEVIKYEDLVALGSELKCKEAGKLAVEGKNYVVQDGDILHIRFNV